MDDKNQPIERVYFFQREDGGMIYVGAREAWNLWRGRQQIIGFERPRLKYVGSSDGEKFRQALLASKDAFATGGLEAAQEALRKGVDEELEAARLNTAPPPNFDEVDERGNPVNIKTLGQ